LQNFTGQKLLKNYVEKRHFQICRKKYTSYGWSF